MKDGKIITDFYVNPTDTHQYLDSSSCHPYPCKKVSLRAKLFAIIESVPIMPFLIRDVTNQNTSYMSGDIDSERVVTQEILKARKIPRNELLEKERNHPEENKLTFNIKY